MLGEDLARAFHSVIADIRDAIYLSEVPGAQESKLDDGKIGLNFPLGDSAVLEVEPVGLDDATKWSQVHRIRLIRIVQDGKLLA